LGILFALNVNVTVCTHIALSACWSRLFLSGHRQPRWPNRYMIMNTDKQLCRQRCLVSAWIIIMNICVCAVCITLKNTDARGNSQVGWCSTHANRFFTTCCGTRVPRPKTMKRTHAHLLTYIYIYCLPHTQTCERRVNRILHLPVNDFLVLFCLIVTYRCSFVNARLPHTSHTATAFKANVYIFYLIKYFI